VLNFDTVRAWAAPALVQAIATAVSSLPERPGQLAVAVSGGPDSAMLAVHALVFGRRESIGVHFLHVHHGLQAHADQWQAHVHDLANMLQAPCHSRRVEVDGIEGYGIESAARDARYTALAQLAGHAGVRHILLAHHRNDQAETVLLRLLRGAGPTGLAAMAPVSRRQGIIYFRPWLDVDRAGILDQAESFGAMSGWDPVRDPTNADDKYTRAAVRQRLVPELNARWPGWQGNVARHARLSGEVSQVLAEVAADDYARLDPSADGCGFSLQAWRGLSVARQALVLRYWLSLHGQRMPSDARLQNIMRQLRGLHALGHDREMRVKHGAAWIRCVRGRVVLTRE